MTAGTDRGNSVGEDFTPRMKLVLKRAAEEARKVSQKLVGTEHVLLALLADHNGIAGQVSEP